MEKIPKTSLHYYLSEYLEDLKRAGVKDFFRAARAPERASASSRAPAAEVGTFETRVSRATPTDSASTREPSSAPSATIPTPPTDDRVARLMSLANEVSSCRLCDELVANRTQTVFGVGNPRAELLFLGEGPGAEEDLRGEPFVGRSGKLLTDMIEKGMGISRDSVFICNVVRCRPPGNRNPTDEEARACRPFLDATLAVVRPKFICCLGSVAATNLLNATTSLGKLRGEVHTYGEAKVVCTYHPAYLLRNPSAKKDAWLDLQLLMREMGLSVPKR